MGKANVMSNKTNIRVSKAMGKFATIKIRGFILTAKTANLKSAKQFLVLQYHQTVYC